MTTIAPASLDISIKPIYLIHGYDPGQIIDLLQQVKSKFPGVKKYYFANFKQFIQFTQDNATEFANQDLFAQMQINKLVEVYIGSGKFTKSQLKELDLLLDKLTTKWTNTVIVLVADKLAKTILQVAWVKKIAKLGLVLATKNISAASMRSWAAAEFKRSNLAITQPGLNLFVELHQQDIIAAKQSIQKLSTLFRQQSEQDIIINEDCLRKWLNIDNKFNLFDLQNALNKRNREQVVKILYALKNQHQEEILVLWALIQQINKISPRSDKLPELLNNAAEIDLLIKNIDLPHSNNYVAIWAKLFDLSLKLSN
jgi:DNA polymerase III delta subunit